MNEIEFVKWFKGFSEGVHHYNITPKQWDLVKEKLAKVGKKSANNYIIDSTYWNTNNT